MGVLVAEDFEPQLIKSIADGQIARPEHGARLAEATSSIVGPTPVVTWKYGHRA
jgi:hypothetical protein